MATQLGHTLQGAPSGPRFTQLSAFARIRGGGRLACATGPREQIGMGHTPVGYLPCQRGGDVALTDDVIEGLGPVLAIKGLVLHRLLR